MAVQLESAARLAALRDKADAVTGESSATLAGAVDALIAGFGSGGGTDDLATAIVERSITEYKNDTITTIGTYAFHSCKELTKLEVPLVTSIGDFAFNGCSKLTEARLPNLIGRPGTSAFQDATMLTFADLGLCDNLGYNTFYDTPLKILILRRKDGVATLPNISAFTHVTGFTVYVPSALLEDYKTATNWVTLYDAGTCDFAAIEGSEYE